VFDVVVVLAESSIRKIPGMALMIRIQINRQQIQNQKHHRVKMKSLRQSRRPLPRPLQHRLEKALFLRIPPPRRRRHQIRQFLQLFRRVRMVKEARRRR